MSSGFNEFVLALFASSLTDFVNPVNEHGRFTEEVPDFQDQFVKDADPAIIEALKTSGRLFKTAPYVHSYPFCWRCKTPLIYYAKDTWFIEGTKCLYVEHVYDDRGTFEGKIKLENTTTKSWWNKHKIGDIIEDREMCGYDEFIKPKQR